MLLGGILIRFKVYLQGGGFISSPQYLNLISIVDKIEVGGK